ncbi:MAG: D-glycerate dehydrogenase [Burkholderiales bacterium]|nr:D-glycerate dehydrogenase [Burkholderiales bacterium]
MRQRIYITQPVAQSAIARLQKVADVKWNTDAKHIMTRDELIAAARECDILFCLLHDRVPREVIEANPKLKAVASMTITPADIDIAAATAHNIPVTTIPALLVDDATADIAWALLLSVVRRTVEGDRLVRTGVFPGSQSSYLEGGAVSGKTLGVIGMGGIGRAMVERARGFKMKVLYYSRKQRPESEEKALGMTWMPFDDVLAKSDIVSINIKLTPETRHLISDREFGLMKPTAYIVNTARGPIINEKALVRALKEKKIAGAGIDVFENEPTPDPALFPMENVVLTPHMGSAIREVREGMANVVVDNILALLEGKQPPNCWNPEVYAAPK